MDALRQSKELIDRLTAETDRTLQRRQFITLRAPINGTVQQLSAYTVGGVVMEKQAIMVIAPEKSSLEVEALVANKDIGFVRADQQVVVKVESFPYTRYGYLTGKVTPCAVPRSPPTGVLRMCRSWILRPWRP